MIQGHGGNIYALARALGCPPDAIIDMSSNINPLGAPTGLLDYLRNHLECISVLPEVDASAAVRHMAGLLGVDPQCMLAGCGTTQFIYMVCPALKVKKALIVGPTYADYADACHMYGVQPHHFLTRSDQGFEVDTALLDQACDGVDTVFICNPNNPTGRLMRQAELDTLCRKHPGTRFIIDESYLPFAPAEMSRSMTGCGLDNVAVLWSLSKIFGLPGVRAGFLIANESVLSRFRRLMQPWSLNALAQAAVDYLGTHMKQVHDFIDETKRYLQGERQEFSEAIASLPLLVTYPSQSSFLLLGLPPGLKAHTVCRRMAERRILIRNCHNFHGLSDRYIRLALKDRATNRIALDRLMGIADQAAAVD